MSSRYYGMLTAAPVFGVDFAERLTPENVADGAPDTVAAVGAALVMIQSVSTTDLNDQSVPVSLSCNVMSNRLPCNASAVSCAATSPIALTVIENVIAWGA